MKVGWFEALMRRLGLSAGDVPVKTPRAEQLESRLQSVEQRYAVAVRANDRSARRLQLHSVTTAHRMTEIGRAVKGVTDRLEDRS